MGANNWGGGGGGVENIPLPCEIFRNFFKGDDFQ